MSVHVCIRTGIRWNHCVYDLATGLGSVLSVQILGILVCVYQCVLTEVCTAARLQHGVACPSRGFGLLSCQNAQ